MKAAFTIRNLFLVLILFSIPGCMEKKTENAIRSYKLWSGEKPPKELQVIHGKYWESSHWSKEYILYLDLKASSFWINQFILQNHLVPAEKIKMIPGDRPTWFNPSWKSKIFTQPGDHGDSVYYYDSLNHELFIYEIQL